MGLLVECQVGHPKSTPSGQNYPNAARWDLLCECNVVNPMTHQQNNHHFIGLFGIDMDIDGIQWWTVVVSKLWLIQCMH